MNRTFHQHVSAQGVLTVVVLAVVGLWCFLARTGVSPLIGLACLMLGAAMVDRLVNTTYLFTPDGRLVIKRGRLGRQVEICVDEIVSTRIVKGTLFTARHIVIEYGYGKATYAQPSDESGFVDEIHHRQYEMDNENETAKEEYDEDKEWKR